MHVFRRSACVSNHSMVASLRGSDSMRCATVASFMEVNFSYQLDVLMNVRTF
jgi:hypothetical protein